MAKLLIALLSAPIRVYRALISPLLPHVCRFTPSCSVYALEALRLHGPVKGLWLALRRLARCHPITWLGGSSGFDPVPLSKTQHP
ncbi:MAG TPA: membrane protein insertion efficiency factor YidD [Rhizomicrobium sp.]|jgi:putative membrane protein insertion efficiency factor|nr:membrane protein insertion efficiency factor YidD [Rhizomicrobium sp.]